MRVLTVFVAETSPVNYTAPHDSISVAGYGRIQGSRLAVIVVDRRTPLG
jgi:hypothetical protein